MSIKHRSVVVGCCALAVLAGCADDNASTATTRSAPTPTDTAITMSAPTTKTSTTTATSTTTPASTTAVATSTTTRITPASTTIVATTAPSTTASAPPAPRLFDQAGPLDAGIYLVEKFGTPLHITVPAVWSTFGDFALLSPEGFEAGYLGFWEFDDVKLDACHWQGRANVGPSVDELVAGLRSQLGMHVSGPTAIELDSRPGQALTLSPADVDPATCDGGVVSPWFEADGDSRFYAAPGETETVWIVDLHGRRALLNAGSVAEMAPATRMQLDKILASIRLG
jgi:hypothetical protein